MNLFNSLPTKILPQKPSASIEPMSSDEAMEILSEHVAENQCFRRGSLKKIKITSINQSVAYKYTLNRFVIIHYVSLTHQKLLKYNS